jgi:conjugal transfer ATP-binding protein TraC
VLLMLLYRIQQEMFLGDRSVKKMMVIDEAWDLMGTAETRNFIIALYRRVRKAGGSVITITQAVSDYWANPGTVAMIENSANKYLLRQTGEAISAVQKENRLELGEWGYQTLRSVHTVKGEFSEILSITNRGTGVGRLVVSDFNKLLYSTDAQDVSAIKRYRDQGLPVTEAVNRVLRDRKRERAA